MGILQIMISDIPLLGFRTRTQDPDVYVEVWALNVCVSLARQPHGLTADVALVLDPGRVDEAVGVAVVGLSQSVSYREAKYWASREGRPGYRACPGFQNPASTLNMEMSSE